MARRLVVPAVIVGLAVAILPDRSSMATSDLLVGPGQNGNWYSVSAAVEVGKPFSFGNVIAAPADQVEPITIQSVRLTGIEGLEVVGISAHGGDRRYSMVGTQQGYEPARLGDVQRLRGAVVPMQDGLRRAGGLALTFGVRRTSKGRGHATGFDVVYSVGGETFRQHFASGIALCAVSAEEVDGLDCPTVPDPDPSGGG